MKSTIIFAIINGILAVAYFVVYIWNKVRRLMSTFRRGI